MRHLGLPVFSYGHLPSGPPATRPQHTNALGSANLGDVVVTTADLIIADDDGAVVVSVDDVESVLATAREIVETERKQVSQVNEGHSLRDQLAFAAYLARRADDPSYDFRRHLRERGGAIER